MGNNNCCGSTSNQTKFENPTNDNKKLAKPISKLPKLDMKKVNETKKN